VSSPSQNRPTDQVLLRKEKDERMNPIRRLLNTASVLAYRPVERTVPFWPTEWIERLQRYRLRAIIRHAYETVPFYRQAMDERGLRPTDFRTLEDLAKLPLIDGMTVQRDVEAFLSTRYGDDSRQPYYTLGSTSGIRRVIYWDNASVLRKQTYGVRDRAVLSNLLGQGTGYLHLHISASGSASSYAEMSASWQASTLISQSRARHRSLSAGQPFELVAETINDLRPEVVSSHGSYAEQFFRFLSDRQMTLSVPRVWVYGSDMLPPSGRELIENMFGCPVYSTYQATETGRLGFQCEKRQGFHLNIDLCALRLIDEHERTVEPGQSGDVVISNLHNRAMVLLNYRLGDRAVLASEPCSCGRSLPMLEHLEGRTTEVVYLADGRSIPGLALEGLCKVELRPTLQIQIVQHAPGQIEWRIVPFSSADRDALRRKLLEKCRLVLGEDTQVEVEFVETIPFTPQGKFLRVVSHIEAPDAPDAVSQGEE
jgi:phenylacetate-CoA ligase